MNEQKIKELFSDEPFVKNNGRISMNKKLQEIVNELLNSDDVTIRESKEHLIVALRSKGCTEEEIREVIKSFEALPLDDKPLESVAGGLSIPEVWVRSTSKIR